ncbi:ABC transporter ATP-binding protein [Ancylobacter terrae]|uniref:ABC transporter ATP-binding protein n=1 Tax=Ancylobacter sp. sgz301288 TaxID=3342077 RepID=UPI00385DD136
MATIRVENLNKTFAEFVAVRDSTFTVEDGEFFCLLGPSGCGKTTTLRMIAGLELPTSGTITLGGQDVTTKRAGERDIAMVFQLFALYPHMNVRQNIGFPLKCMGLPRAEITRKVEEAARILRISHLLDSRVSGLSGGDRQRIALGRAIVREPAAFMMDEPLGALDAEFRHLMCGELRALHDRLKATTVYVTHDQMEAMAMADKIAVMNRGVIEQFAGPQEIYDRPASLFVADFIGSPAMNLIGFAGSLALGARFVTIEGAPVEVPVVREAVAEQALVLGVRPEHVRFSDASALRGEVYGTEYLGTTQIVTVTTASGPVRARLPSTVKVSTGEQVGLALRADRLSLFEKAGGRAIRTAWQDGERVEGEAAPASAARARRENAGQPRAGQEHAGQEQVHG